VRPDLRAYSSTRGATFQLARTFPRSKRTVDVGKALKLSNS